MCTEAVIRRDGKEEGAQTVGQLRALGFDPVAAFDSVDHDDFCLCGVDLYATAKAAGYRARKAAWNMGYWPGTIIIWKPAGPVDATVTKA